MPEPFIQQLWCSHAAVCRAVLCLQITAGEQIDLMFGAKLGLSSMAAAGLGNTVADVVGINISHTIEVRVWAARQACTRV